MPFLSSLDTKLPKHRKRINPKYDPNAWYNQDFVDHICKYCVESSIPIKGVQKGQENVPHYNCDFFEQMIREKLPDLPDDLLIMVPYNYHCPYFRHVKDFFEYEYTDDIEPSIDNLRNNPLYKNSSIDDVYEWYYKTRTAKLATLLTLEQAKKLPAYKALLKLAIRTPKQPHELIDSMYNLIVFVPDLANDLEKALQIVKESANKGIDPVSIASQSKN